MCQLMRCLRNSTCNKTLPSIGNSRAIEKHKRSPRGVICIIPPACGERIRCQRLPNRNVRTALKHNRLIRLPVDSDSELCGADLSDIQNRRRIRDHLHHFRCVKRTCLVAVADGCQKPMPSWRCIRRKQRRRNCHRIHIRHRSSRNAHLQKQLLVAVERIRIVIEINAHNRIGVGWTGPLIIVFQRNALSLHDRVCLKSIELYQACPCAVVRAQSSPIVGRSSAQIPPLVITISYCRCTRPKRLSGAESVRTANQTVLKTGVRPFLFECGPPRIPFRAGNGGLGIASRHPPIDCAMIPEMNIRMGRRITSRQTGQITAIRPRHSFTVGIRIAVLPVVIMKQNIGERFNGRIGNRERIEKSVVVQRMRIKSCQLVHPNTIRSQPMTDLGYQRAAAEKALSAVSQSGKGGPFDIMFREALAVLSK